MDEAQLAEWSLTTSKIRGLNPIIGNSIEALTFNKAGNDSIENKKVQ